MVKVIIENFGPIQHCEIDLEKDLHLIYGKNSVGKSYAASCVYNLLKNLMNGYQLNGNEWSCRERYRQSRKAFEQKVARFQQERTDADDVHVDVSAEVIENSKSLFEYLFLENIRNSFINTYAAIANLQNRYSNQPFLLKLIIGMYGITLRSHRDDFLEITDFEIDSTIELINIESTGLYYFENEEVEGFQYEVLFDQRHLLLNGIYDAGVMIIHDIMTKLTACVEHIYFLPASRSGLYQGLNAMSPLIAELSKFRSAIKTKIELPALSEPVADYFLHLSTVEVGRDVTPFAAIIEQIEHTVLHGVVRVEPQTKKLMFHPDQTDLNLELTGASSMVAELAPIVAYLKHIVRKTPCLLFLEEPEAHLHPEAQVALMALFVELARNGVKLCITSHSNYMFNKLGNLLLQKKADPEKTAVYHLVMTEQGSVVSDDMRVDADGIDDQNFSVVSEQLYNERMALYEKDEQ